MPWQLTTPVNVGGLDDGNYDQVRITRLTHDSVRGFLSVQVEYGRTVNNEWVTGYAPKDKLTNFHIEGQPYIDLLANSTPNAGPPVEKTYDAVKRGLYEWLNTNGHIAAGSIV